MSASLAGRQREVRLLQREFQKALSEQTAVAMIVGEPGIGKTRLLTQFAQEAEQKGALLLNGIAFDMEGMPPYLPFLEALGHYIRAAPLALLRKQLDVHAATLAGLFPEIKLRLDNLPEVYNLHPEQARYRLFEAIASFLSNLCQKQPALLLLDDLQWADAASLDLLIYLVHHLPHVRLMILGTARRSEGTEANFPHLLAELERMRNLTLIELSPLAQDEVTELAGHYLGAPLATEAGQTLFERSEGSPFFAEELLRNWQETQRLVYQGAFWRLTAQSQEHVPASILRAIEQRLARLPAQTVETLRSAAIVGRRFAVGLLADATGQSGEAVEADLAPAIQANLIRYGKRGCVFGHDLIREVLYQQVSPRRRQRLHGFIGRALEARHQTHDSQQLSNLARHFTRSGDSERGIHYVQLAAEEAMHAYAPRQAIRHYQTGLDLIEQRVRLGLSVPSNRGALLLGLGEASLQGGMERDAIGAFTSALAWFQEHDDQHLAVRGAYGLGHAQWHVENIPAAEEAFGLALRLLEDSTGAEAAQTHIDLANLLVLSRHEHAQGMHHAQRGLEIAQQLSDDLLMAAALRTLGNLHVRANQLAQGIAHLDQALTLAMRTDSPHEAAEICTGLLMALMWYGNIDRCHEIAMQLIDLAYRCQSRYYLRHVYGLLSVLFIVQGKLTSASQSLAQGEEVVASLASPEPQGFLLLCRAYVNYYTGEHETMLANVREAITIFRSLGEDALVWYLGFEALAYALNGRFAEARASRDELEALLCELPKGVLSAAEGYTHLTLLALVTGENDCLHDLYPRLLPYQGQFHDATLDRLLGTIESMEGQWEAAETWLETAESTTRRTHMRWELAHTLIARADLVLARGGSGSVQRARTYLAEALDLIKIYDNQVEIKRIRSRLRDLPTQPGAKPQALAPAGLSRRELEVLRLLAQGQSNREIAQNLALSPKTIANHVTMIFNKIGVDNRAAAAAFAVRQGID